jgi:phage/plasmid-like protein (TIGR03299 family)
MAHELNELAPGIHSYAGAREHAWHRLGVTLDSTMTAEEALAAAHLVGWDVRKVALKTEPIIGPNGVTVLDIPDRFATVYTNPLTGEVRYLGTVGSHYDPTQNEESTDLLQAVTDLSGAIFETAGSLRGGKETFVTIRLPETMLVGGKDPVGLYLAALNSHDGSSAQRCIVTPVRILCARDPDLDLEGRPGADDGRDPGHPLGRLPGDHRVRRFLDAGPRRRVGHGPREPLGPVADHRHPQDPGV